jgi:hypothetical protein
MGAKTSRESLGDSIHEDACVAVCEHGVEIKRYYFPTKQSKFVRFDELTKAVWVVRDKDWGMGTTGNWWPWAGFFQQFNRGIRLDFIKERSVGCCLSVEDDGKFDEVLRLINDSIHRTNGTKPVRKPAGGGMF